VPDGVNEPRESGKTHKRIELQVKSAAMGFQQSGFPHYSIKIEGFID
jgi:hypothetical protein